MAQFPVPFPSASSALCTVTKSGTPTLYTLTLHNGADNRLTTQFITEALHPALNEIERDWRSSEKGGKWDEAALVITGKGAKFFSNGLDFEKAIAEPGFFGSVLDPLLVRLLTFPIPTVCALNGHAFAGGFVVALCSDYIIGKQSGRGWLCMNEVEFGASIPPGLLSILRLKLPTTALLRKTVLEGHRYTPAELHAVGVIDALASEEQVQQKAEELARSVAGKAKTGVWGSIKREAYRGVIEIAQEDKRQPDQFEQNRRALAKL